MSTSKADIKWIRSLHLKKFRNDQGLYVVEGRKMCEEAFRDAEVVRAFTIDPSENTSSQWELVSLDDMARMSALHSPSPCLAIVKQRRLETWGVKGNTCLVLDGISDPGNFGTLIRTAEWFGVHSIFCTADTVDCYNPKSIQSSMGSIFRQDIYYGEPDQLVEFLSRKNFSLLAAMLEGESVFDYPWPTSAALVIGSESHGIRPNWQSSIQHKLTIPGAAGAESLNAAIAGSILMAERFRTIH